MKKYRVMYRPNKWSSELSAQTQEVYADGWRVDSEHDRVVLFTQSTFDEDVENEIFDVPKAQILRIQEITG
jgi:hypothetical protein